MKLIIMSGIPASGKTTITNHIVDTNPNAMVLHRDVVRASLRSFMQTDKYFPVDTKSESTIWLTLAAQAIKNRNHEVVVLDQTTLTTQSLTQLIKSIKHLRDMIDEVEIMLVRCPLDTCLDRNARREGHELVPEKTLTNMSRTFAKFYKIFEDEHARQLVDDHIMRKHLMHTDFSVSCVDGETGALIGKHTITRKK